MSIIYTIYDTGEGNIYVYPSGSGSSAMPHLEKIALKRISLLLTPGGTEKIDA